MKKNYFVGKGWFKEYYPLLFVFCFSGNLTAQPPTLRAYAEVGGLVSTARQTPFWLRANQWGTVPLDAPLATLRVGARRDYRLPPPDSTRRKARFDWGFGAEALVNQGAERAWLLPEAYAKLRWGAVEVLAGRRRQVLGIVDTVLTSGSLTWSGNALPVPLVQLGLPEYLPVRFLGNFLAVKGFYAHGWFNAPYIQHAFLHQKTIYFRLGRPSGRVQVHLGLVHHAQWGGQADYLLTSPFAVNGKLTTSLRDYLTGVVLGRLADDYQNSRYTPFDGENRVGNHVGHFDMALTLRRPRAAWLLYRQHPFEDLSGVFFQNIPDGLLGLRWQNAGSPGRGFRLQRVLVEWLHTKNQAGTSFLRPGTRFRGADNYFNHSQYIEGWSYFGQGLGTPLLALDYQMTGRGNTDLRFFSNNRLNAWHLGAEARLGKLALQTKLTYSRNFGTYNAPFAEPVSQFSAFAQVQAPVGWLGGGSLVARAAYDGGGLYPKALGLYVGVRKEWGGGATR